MPTLKIIHNVADLHAWCRRREPGRAVARIDRGDEWKGRAPLTPRIVLEPAGAGAAEWWGKASAPVGRTGKARAAAFEAANTQLDTVCAELALMFGWTIDRPPRTKPPKWLKARRSAAAAISDGHAAVLRAAADGPVNPTAGSKLGLARELIRDCAARGWIDRDARGAFSLLPAGRTALRRASRR